MMKTATLLNTETKRNVKKRNVVKEKELDWRSSLELVSGRQGVGGGIQCRAIRLSGARPAQLR